MKDSERQACVGSTEMELSQAMSLAELDRFHPQETKTCQTLARKIGVDTQ